MSYRAVWHSNRKEIIRSANLKYLDARTRSATRAGSEQLFVLCNILRDDNEFLDVTRAVDELQSCLAQQSNGNPQKR
eukprot:733841-Pyramimonas_sp.AAC.1